MTIFKETLDSEYQTISEVKELLADVEMDRAADPDRELRYELARAIEHVNRFGELSPEESRALVEDLTEHEEVDLPTAIKIADLRPQSRDELRSVFAKRRYQLDGDELDAVLGTVAKHI